MEGIYLHAYIYIYIYIYVCIEKLSLSETEIIFYFRNLNDLLIFLHRFIRLAFYKYKVISYLAY